MIHGSSVRGCLAHSLAVSLLAAGLFRIGESAGRAAEDPFAANVRPTEPLSPVDQVRAFDVPEGFEMQLVAHEPQINKPMNLAFDAMGRLWVTTSIEYPRPAPADRAGRDRLMIFEDFGPDGRARKVTEFAGGLNIPIGVYPFRSKSASGATTWKAVVWSIPNLWLLEDTDGDGKADRREVLYGPFDHTRDTHGNQASFRRGFDGWLYATHGFNNDSHVAGRDGNRVDLNSGNTYRVRLDGRRIEQHTWGQVNPFGLAWDAEGNLYSSDCHSEPIYLLLAGGYYPSFGKPHDGLGFAPSMMEAIRGSTAIDGISYYADDLWPEEYRDGVFIGDVMTSRVYHDRAVARGSGKVTQARPDLIVSRDPWFRPVDTTLGPDGALYVADFYNRIIGHYEVPLDHPGRDRERGRLWRLVRRGVPLRPPALAQDLEGLVNEMASPSLSRRLLAMNDLQDRFGGEARPMVERRLAKPENANQQVHLLWYLHRLGGAGQESILQMPPSSDPLVRIHMQRIAGEVLSGFERGDAVTPTARDAALALATRGTRDTDPRVQRCAAEALGNLAASDSVPVLLELLSRAPETDRHLRYTVRRSLRNILRSDAVFEVVAARTDLTAADTRALLEVAMAVKSGISGRFVLRHLDVFGADREALRNALAHASRHVDATAIEALVEKVQRQRDGDLDFELSLFQSIQQGLRQRGGKAPVTVRSWSVDLSDRLLRSVEGADTWSSQPIDGAAAASNLWDYQERAEADGRSVRLLSSHPHGEQLTGHLVSAAFPAPAQLSFLLAGHDGVPDKPPAGRNRVLLREAETGTVLREAFPPRHDQARRVTWDLAELAGRRVVFEIIDADDGPAYAWLAFGGFENGPLKLPAVAPANVVARQVAAAELASFESEPTPEMAAGLARLMRRQSSDPMARGAAARALSSDPLHRAVAAVAMDGGLPTSWRGRLADAVFAENRDGWEPLIASVWRDAPRSFQLRFAEIASATAELTQELVRRMKEGSAPAALLQDRRLQERLRRTADDGIRGVISDLVASLPDEDASVQRLLEERRSGYAGASTNVERGREIFTAACAVCHQINGVGGLVGPQLSGIGTRGLERLCEDVLAPHRNVDHAFWSTILVLKDGETVSGLMRREEGEVLVVANAGGSEVSVPKASIAERKISNLSVMPSNFSEALSPEDFYHLIAYLLAQRGTP
ncbi:MAG: c-type cytochrome [Verrucomicrobiales bacterium]|nr:c-type cytochrome [Verrucomicrobiales bacterium]